MMAVAAINPANAIYTQCTVRQEIKTLDRPGGNTISRLPPLAIGEKVTIISVYNSKTNKGGSGPYDWVFIGHRYVDDEQQRGWVPANALSNCQPMDGNAP
jgi:hypothetical protein